MRKTKQWFNARVSLCICRFYCSTTRHSSQITAASRSLSWWIDASICHNRAKCAWIPYQQRSDGVNFSLAKRTISIGLIHIKNDTKQQRHFGGPLEACGRIAEKREIRAPQSNRNEGKHMCALCKYIIASYFPLNLCASLPRWMRSECQQATSTTTAAAAAEREGMKMCSVFTHNEIIWN